MPLHAGSSCSTSYISALTSPLLADLCSAKHPPLFRALVPGRLDWPNKERRSRPAGVCVLYVATGRRWKRAQWKLKTLIMIGWSIKQFLLGHTLSQTAPCRCNRSLERSIGVTWCLTISRPSALGRRKISLSWGFSGGMARNRSWCSDIGRSDCCCLHSS